MTYPPALPAWVPVSGAMLMGVPGEDEDHPVGHRAGGGRGAWAFWGAVGDVGVWECVRRREEGLMSRRDVPAAWDRGGQGHGFQAPTGKP